MILVQSLFTFFYSGQQGHQFFTGHWESFSLIFYCLVVARSTPQLDILGGGFEDFFSSYIWGHDYFLKWVETHLTQIRVVKNCVLHLGWTNISLTCLHLTYMDTRGRCQASKFVGRSRKPPLVCSVFVWLQPGRNSLCHLVEEDIVLFVFGFNLRGLGALNVVSHVGLDVLKKRIEG